MLVLAIVLATLAAVLHVGFFALESVLWMQPWTRRIFGIQSLEQAEATRALAYNQGFYNLFLAVGVLLGTIIFGFGLFAEGRTLMLFCLAGMLAAAIVLFTTGKRYLGGALIQGTLPLLALVLLLLAR